MQSLISRTAFGVLFALASADRESPDLVDGWLSEPDGAIGTGRYAAPAETRPSVRGSREPGFKSQQPSSKRLAAHISGRIVAYEAIAPAS